MLRKTKQYKVKSLAPNPVPTYLTPLSTFSEQVTISLLFIYANTVNVNKCISLFSLLTQKSTFICPITMEGIPVPASR